MIDISSDFKAWKAADDRVDPLVHIYDIEIDDSTTLRLVKGAPSGELTVTYDGNTYSIAAIDEGEYEQNIEYDLPERRLTVSNIDGIAGGYIENYELDGRRVTIRRMTLSSLRAGPGTGDVLTETWTILSQSYDRHTASVNLGPPPIFERRCPWRRMARQRCAWDWERRFQDGNGCHYPSDEFAGDTEQDFIVGADDDSDQTRRHGWHSINLQRTREDSTETIAGVNVIDSDGDGTPDGYYISTNATGLEWSSAVREAPFVFKLLSGDFDVSTKIHIFGRREGLMAGLLCQEVGDSYDSWIVFGIGCDSELEIQTLERSAVDGVDETGTNGTEAEYLRLRRVGNVFTCFTSTDGLSWSQFAEHTLALETETRLGLVLACDYPGPIFCSAGFRYFRFTAGGDATCDRTLTACSAKGNVHRHFAFPGIPRS